jgi:hypothetical protein
VLAVEVEKVAVGLAGVAVVAADHGRLHFLKMTFSILSSILSTLRGVTK